MTRTQQKKFVKELATRVANEIREQILSGKIPEEWDGHELRCLLADRFNASADMSVIKAEPRQRRARNYRNTVLVNNL